jgi:hypothetical protein
MAPVYFHSGHPEVSSPLLPAKAGIQQSYNAARSATFFIDWMPTFVGMSGLGSLV